LDSNLCARESIYPRALLCLAIEKSPTELSTATPRHCRRTRFIADCFCYVTLRSNCEFFSLPSFGILYMRHAYVKRIRVR